MRFKRERECECEFVNRRNGIEGSSQKLKRPKESAVSGGRYRKKEKKKGGRARVFKNKTKKTKRQRSKSSE